MSTIQEKAPLGSVGNPYEYSEYKRIFSLGNWTRRLCVDREEQDCPIL